MKFGRIGCFCFVVLYIGLASAGLLVDVLGGDLSCENSVKVFEEKYKDYKVPSGIPFSDDVFAVYVDGEFFAFVKLVDGRVDEIRCEKGEGVSYNIYVSSLLVGEVFEGMNVIDFYNEKRASGELEIKGVGFGSKMKLGFVNLGMKISGWFV